MQKINVPTEIESLRKMNRLLVRSLFLFIILCSSCDSRDVVFNQSETLGGHWDSNQFVTFHLPEMDSITNYNLFLNLRNTNAYQFNNIFLIVSMEFPHGKSVVDTLEYRMANPDGSWMGQGIGNIKESKLWYKENVRFFEEGTYTVKVAHAMRNNGEVEGVKNLKGIVDVGFTVEKSSNHN